MVLQSQSHTQGGASLGHQVTAPTANQIVPRYWPLRVILQSIVRTWLSVSKCDLAEGKYVLICHFGNNKQFQNGWEGTAAILK